MAKILTEILPVVNPTQGMDPSDYDTLRDRYLHAFEPPTVYTYDQWTSYYGSVADDVTRQVWTVPTGTTIAKFELWGAGGGGAGANCCQQGVSGGSGAYAWKEISVTPGDRYILCLGDYSEYCCTQRCQTAQDCLAKQTGYKGPTAYVLGTGLSNFCAEGGNPGVTAFCPAYHMHGRTPEADGRKCCCYCWTTCELFTGGTPTRTLDSDNDIMRCACYYGADGGVRGTRGYMKVSCCGLGANDNACGIRWGVPYPGGLWEKPNRGYRGGVIEVAYQICCYCCGLTSIGSCQVSGRLGAGFGQNSVKMRGVGGPSASASDGQNTCGARGGPSAIWISYCQDKKWQKIQQIL